MAEGELYFEMKLIESLEQYSGLIQRLKDRTGCKALKSNCYLTPGEITSCIAQKKWHYIETPGKLYFLRMEEHRAYLYYYEAEESKPETDFDFGLPVIVDLVMRERQVPQFEQGAIPLWEESGFEVYKKYQRMRYRHPEDDFINVSDGNLIRTAEPGQAEEISFLWRNFLDEYDIELPSMEETARQLEEGNVVCYMDEGRVYGAILVHVNGHSGLIQHVTVHPDYRKRAIGEHMMRYAYRHMNPRGVNDFRLWVDEKNVAAIKLYSKTEWKQDGTYSIKLVKGCSRR